MAETADFFPNIQWTGSRECLADYRDSFEEIVNPNDNLGYVSTSEDADAEEREASMEAFGNIIISALKEERAETHR